jgi:hypothetical protein
VLARQVERHVERLARGAPRAEAHPSAVVLDGGRRDRRFRACSVREHRLRHLREDLPHHRVIGAQHRRAIERQVLQELHERLLQLGEVVLVGLHVVGVDVGDDGDHRLQVEERGVGFVGFDDDEVAGAEACVRAGGVEPPADDEGWIEPALREHARDQAGGGGLAVRAGDGDALLQRISSASMSARGTSGTRFARAAATSGLSACTAEDTTTASRHPPGSQRGR